MKKILISAVLALMLVAVLAVPAGADVSQDVDATVTVSSYSSVTITAGTITFGSLVPGTTKSAATNNPAVNIEAGSENNQNITVELSGTDFSDSGTNSFDVTNAFWNITNDSDTADTVKLAASADTVATLSAGEDVDVYHWLSVPVEQEATSYTSTFTYHTNATSAGP